MKEYCVCFEIIDIIGEKINNIQFYLRVRGKTAVINKARPVFEVKIDEKQSFDLILIKNYKEFDKISLSFQSFFAKTRKNKLQKWVLASSNAQLKILLIGKILSSIKLDEKPGSALSSNSSVEIASKLCPFIAQAKENYEACDLTQFLNQRMLKSEIDSEKTIKIYLDHSDTAIPKQIIEKYVNEKIRNINMDEIAKIPPKVLNEIIRVLVKNVKTEMNSAVKTSFFRTRLNQEIDTRLEKHKKIIDFNQDAKNEKNSHMNELEDAIITTEDIKKMITLEKQRKKNLKFEIDQLKAESNSELMENVLLKAKLFKIKYVDQDIEKIKKRIDDDVILENRLKQELNKAQGKLDEIKNKFQDCKQKKNEEKDKVLRKIEELKKIKDQCLDKNKKLTEKLEKNGNFSRQNSDLAIKNSEKLKKIIGKKQKTYKDIYDMASDISANITEVKNTQKSFILKNKFQNQSYQDLEKEKENKINQALSLEQKILKNSSSAVVHTSSLVFAKKNSFINNMLAHIATKIIKNREYFMKSLWKSLKTLEKQTSELSAESVDLEEIMDKLEFKTQEFTNNK